MIVPRRISVLLVVAMWILTIAPYIVTHVEAQSTAESHKVERFPKLRKINLGSEINSGYSELAPIISPDGKLLFFTMGAGNPNNLGDEHLQDCYVSHRLSDGRWSAPQNLGPPINSTGNDAISGVSPDGSVLFIKNFGYNHLNGLCFAQATGKGSWKIDSITIERYSNSGPLATQCISSDGKYIIFSADRRDGYGGTDLYVSALIDAAKSRYGPPQNLGVAINTSSDEFAPFLAADGRTLYFSSKGHGGYGSSDVFVSRRLDTSWDHWTAPKNLGPELNTSGMDAYYSVPASGDVAYYSSSNGENHMDLYMVTLSDELRPNPAVMLTGKVQNNEGHAVAAGITCWRVLTDSVSATTSSNAYSGRFATVLLAGEHYTVNAEAPGYLPYTGNIDLSGNDLTELAMTITLDTITHGARMVLNNIFFNVGSAILTPESHFALDRIFQLLQANPKWKVSIEGYTDSIGTAEHNLQLSKERAMAVVDYLRTKGIIPERLQAEGWGANEPVASNTTEEGRSRNRRVVLRIVDTGSD